MTEEDLEETWIISDDIEKLIVKNKNSKDSIQSLMNGDIEKELQSNNLVRAFEIMSVRSQALLLIRLHEKGLLILEKEIGGDEKDEQFTSR